jgi:hypothetical protein
MIDHFGVLVRHLGGDEISDFIGQDQSSAGCFVLNAADEW